MNSDLTSSARELRDFILSAVWRDLRNEMFQWLDDIRTQLEVEDQLDVIRKLQGNAEAVNKFLRLPEILAESVEIENGRREL
jgi:hypothetical protein